MEQNKIRTYILYAMGEIALVMIGILLALQVNNWNEERKIDLERLALIETLKSEYESSLDNIKRRLKASEERGLKLKQLLAYSAGDDIEISADSLKIMLQESMISRFSSNFSNTYEEAKSAGKLSLINNQELLKALSKNEENIEGLQATGELSPVFKESFKDFSSKIEFMSYFDRVGNESWSPRAHPEVTLSDIERINFLRSPDTYVDLYQIYFINMIENLWWQNIKISTEWILEEVEYSLND